MSSYAQADCNIHTLTDRKRINNFVFILETRGCNGAINILALSQLYKFRILGRSFVPVNLTETTSKAIACKISFGWIMNVLSFSQQSWVVCFQWTLRRSLNQIKHLLSQCNRPKQYSDVHEYRREAAANARSKCIKRAMHNKPQTVPPKSVC